MKIKDAVIMRPAFEVEALCKYIGLAVRIFQNNTTNPPSVGIISDVKPDIMTIHHYNVAEERVKVLYVKPAEVQNGAVSIRVFNHTAYADN